MLTIAIPTYNYDCTELLEQLRNQVLSSTLKIDITVCDDASTNAQLQNTNKSFCADHNIIYLQNTSNLGRTATRKKLAETAQNDWLLFLDADVLPFSGSFITQYTSQLGSDNPVISGGLAYQKSKPQKAYRLRWKFGKQRESRNALERKKQPYLLASGNLLIKKELFLDANAVLENNYGLDAFFGYQLKQLDASVLHIDNPVYHLGLETNEAFLKKSIKAVETLVTLEQNQQVAKNHTRLQQVYQSLVGKSIVYKIIGSSLGLIRKNLMGNNPSLFLFDLYRLHHYIKLKAHA